MGFVNERTVKSVRKAGQCDGCNTTVNVGEAAVRWAGTTDGDFNTALYHPECREAEVALNRERRTGFYPDDWMGLSRDMEWDDHPWLLAKHPAVAARMGITVETIREDEEEREACRLAWAKLTPPTPARVSAPPRKDDV